jgi:hypothetical protein
MHVQGSTRPRSAPDGSMQCMPRAEVAEVEALVYEAVADTLQVNSGGIQLLCVQFLMCGQRSVQQRSS